MITDRIEWPKNYGNEKADIHVSQQVEVENITGEQIWPNATNIANWSKYSHGIVDAEFVDPSVEDPHLFKKAELSLRTDKYVALATVLTVVEPKGDRPGRLAIETQVHTIDNPDYMMTLVHEFMVSVEHKGKTTVASEINAFGPLAKTATAKVKDTITRLNDQWLSGLLKYTATRHGISAQQEQAEINALHGWS